MVVATNNSWPCIRQGLHVFQINLENILWGISKFTFKHQPCRAEKEQKSNSLSVDVKHRWGVPHW